MSYLRTVGWYLVTGCCCALLGQDAPPNPNAYESFFREVSRLTPESPALENALGATAEEAQALTRIASDCEARGADFSEDMRSVFLSIRLAKFAEEAPPESALRRYDELNRQRAQMVLDHVQAMRTLLGDARFQRIEAVAKSGNGNWSSFLGLPQAPRAVKATAAARQTR
jgi:hypothetical protein